MLFLKHGWLVRSELFRIHQNLGNPVAQVERYNDWNVDELIYIDITPGDFYDRQRTDLGGDGSQNPAVLSEIISLVASKCFMPLTFGGKIRTLEDIRVRLGRGADKITLNTRALEDPSFITSAAHEFGSQAIVVSIDVRRDSSSHLEVFGSFGAQPTGRDPVEWAREAQDRGAGEIFLNSIDRDGTAEGYDVALINAVVSATTIPVIACGGAGSYSDFSGLMRDTDVSAVAAGNIFHFREMAYPLAKQTLRKAGANVR